MKQKIAKRTSKNDKEKKEVIQYTKPEFKIVPQKRSNKPLKVWIKELKGSYSITRNDVCYIYRNIIFTKTVSELKYIFENEEIRDSYPALVITIIASVLGDIARGNMLNLVRMLNFIFPDSMKGFDPNEFLNKASEGGYDEIKELENALKRLEGDDSLTIVDKLLMAEGTHEIVNNAS
jgi:hypothetical protein